MKRRLHGRDYTERDYIKSDYTEEKLYYTKEKLYGKGTI